MMRTVAVLACLAALAAGKAKKPDRSGVEWSPTWAAAVEEARALNLPIVVHRHGFY